MGLVTREEKGSKLTIQEMDGNLTYLENLTEPIGVFDYTTTTSILPVDSPVTIIKTVIIPANTFSNLDQLKLNVCMYQNAFLGSKFRFYINNSTSLTGATQLMNVIYDATGTGLGYYAVNDNILLKNNKIIGMFQETSSFSTGNADPVYYNSAIDLTVDNYIIITYDNTVYYSGINQGCNVNIESVILQKIN